MHTPSAKCKNVLFKGQCLNSVFQTNASVWSSGEGGVLDLFLGGEVRPGPSYPDPF